MIENLKKHFNFIFNFGFWRKCAIKKRGADTMVKAPIGFGLLLNIIDITSLD
jgi:hypothetical protein